MKCTKCTKCNKYISKNSDVCSFCKFKKLRLIVIPIFFLIIILLGHFGIPEFIRSIQGENFIGIWGVFSLIALLLEKIIIDIFSNIYLKKQFNELTTTSYTLNDLLFINKPSQIKYLGYLLLKLKLDNVIEYTSHASTDNNAETSYIKLNNFNKADPACPLAK